MECGYRNKVEIYSINYDFLQTIPYAQKVLWVQLKYQAPPSLRIGDFVRIVSADRHFTPPSEDLKVIDVVGTRVALTSRITDISTCEIPTQFGPGRKRVGRWHPWSHSWHFGYATRDMSAQPYADRGWMFGNGDPISYLVW
jgi:hypothetical protein